MDVSGPVSGLDPRHSDHTALQRSILEKLVYAIGRDRAQATERDWFRATALATRDRIVDRWMASARQQRAHGQKRVYYLSLEFLIGRLLGSNLLNMEIDQATTKALVDLGLDPTRILDEEPDAALGNGGLGRLAACYLESMASVGIAGFGYGIRYDYGLFRQEFEQGWQAERPDNWLRFGNPWEFERPEITYRIGFGGTVEALPGTGSFRRARWEPAQEVLALAYDTPVVGWRGETVNTLRLWSGEPAHVFSLDSFNRGDYMQSVAERVLAKTISRVLYPNDANEAGQELRLKQEYFFTAASLRDIIRRVIARGRVLADLPKWVAIQLNDTHPAIAVPELMRLLIDEHGMEWERAWPITQGCIAYTNHTLMPEALERWPVHLLERLLPRHLQIIYEINGRFLERQREVHQVSFERQAEISLIDEYGGRFVRMGNLAFVGSHKVNGVSALHTALLRKTVFSGLNEALPERIINQTNGITPRRWLYQCNRPLAKLLIDTIGQGWIDDLEKLREIEDHVDDPAFAAGFAKAKLENKQALAAHIATRTGIQVDPEAIFDVHIKRMHEYKRQLLNVLETVALWQAMRVAPDVGWQPRVKIFGGKAAPAYVRAKLIIKLINDVAAAVNRDPAVKDLLKVVYLPDYNVSLAERIIPAADLSEQISTAGTEASGTGNMKFALNGALTIGTLDGANVEIREHVGPENIVIFGLTTEEVAKRRTGGYDARATIDADPKLRSVLELIASSALAPDDPGRFRPIVDDLFNRDHFLLTADFGSYYSAQRQVDRIYGQRETWLRKVMLNTARMGWFSSDRSIRGYATDIWDAMPPTTGAIAAE